jgi:hypothetical protein
MEVFMNPMSLFRSVVIGLILGTIVSVTSYLITSVVTLVARIFGIKELKKVHKELPKDLDAITSKLPSATKSSLSGERKDELPELRAQVVTWLVEQGLSKVLAEAAASQRSRLSWNRELWGEYITHCKDLLREGVPEELISLHSRLTGITPTFHTLQNLGTLRDCGLDDQRLLHHVITKEFSTDEVETMIKLHEVDELPWDICIRTVTTDLDIRRG